MNTTFFLNLKVCNLSATKCSIHNNDKILAVVFFPARTLRVEWIRSLFTFFDRIYMINVIFSPKARYA